MSTHVYRLASCPPLPRTDALQVCLRWCCPTPTTPCSHPVACLTTSVVVLAAAGLSPNDDGACRHPAVRHQWFQGCVPALPATASTRLQGRQRGRQQVWPESRVCEGTCIRPAHVRTPPQHLLATTTATDRLGSFCAALYPCLGQLRHRRAAAHGSRQPVLLHQVGGWVDGHLTPGPGHALAMSVTAARTTYMCCSPRASTCMWSVLLW